MVGLDGLGYLGRLTPLLYAVLPLMCGWIGFGLPGLSGTSDPPHLCCVAPDVWLDWIAWDLGNPSSVSSR